MNDIVESYPKWKKVLIIGWVLVITALIVGPPASIPLFIIGGVMVVVGGNLKRRALPPPVPLSQKPAKTKVISAGIPAILILSVSAFTGMENALIYGIGLLLLAYAIIGVVELKFGTFITPMAAKWDSMASWKKALISVAVIIGSLVAAVALMPLAAQILYT
ncbi:hypothetical protein M0C34_14835 [Agarivorans sp. TSD2052]|uniref:hypothetical protein n=1 Tax=Agarivorans sp. TSD2052 TaxID=2937286 RepID=UPI00200C209E|nr:hypothetical protein [Agarivorans sp. TSD2052]UPW17503.1 hypothetical protein M0C34_14835 [Agarivorans sp. TSD2052]